MDCEHLQYTMRKFPKSDGSFNKVAQCNDCGMRLHMGENGEIWIKKAPGEDISILPLFDAAASERWKAAKDLKYKTESKIRSIENNIAFQQKLKKYDDYILNSPEWAIRRGLVLRRANNLCEACLTSRATQVHHTNYDNLYSELLFDLRALCSKCHEKIHGIGHADT